MWYSRPVLFVADVERSLDFYARQLGFAEIWRHEHEGKLLVAQVDRDDCEIILSCQWPEKNGKGMLFISLDTDVFPAFPDELTRAGVAFTRGHWGYPVVIVDDPDCNQLFFPDPNSTGG